MKFYTIVLGLISLTISHTSDAYEISGKPMGIGESGVPYYFEPQYLPYYPTAATIWPRVIEVPCVREKDGKLTCEGYNWTPAMGRGEYLFIMPKVTEVPVNTHPIETHTIETQTIIREVPPKKGQE